jgi:hypothetical protein
MPCIAAERTMWNKVRYLGGTLHVKASRYDWNTTLTVTPDLITVTIAPATAFTPQQTVRLKPSQVVSLSYGAAAWKRVSEVPGAEVPAQQPKLFGLAAQDDLGIVYETDDGKHGALLLETNFGSRIILLLQSISGKKADGSP